MRWYRLTSFQNSVKVTATWNYIIKRDTWCHYIYHEKTWKINLEQTERANVLYNVYVRLILFLNHWILPKSSRERIRFHIHGLFLLSTRSEMWLLSRKKLRKLNMRTKKWRKTGRKTKNWKESITSDVPEMKLSVCTCRNAAGSESRLYVHTVVTEFSSKVNIAAWPSSFKIFEHDSRVLPAFKTTCGSNRGRTCSTRDPR